MKIQEILEQNHAEYGRKQNPGAPRSGAALLQGIVYCGRCGHQMTIQYCPHAKYTCNYLHQQRRVPVCALIRADEIDQAVGDALWNALRPEELDLLDEAEARIEEEVDTLRTARSHQLQRLRYQAELAERQYQHCDPANRLVAAELEKRWEGALRALRAEEQRLQQEPLTTSRRLTPEQRDAWQAAGASMREMWRDGRLSHQQKKRVLRTLVDKVVIDIVEPGLAGVRIVWRGGEVDTTQVPLRVASLDSLPNSSELKEKIISMARAGLPDEWIAFELSNAGYRQPHLNYVSIGLVSRIRQRHRVIRKSNAKTSTDGFLSLSQAGRRTGVTAGRLFEMILQGQLPYSLNEDNHRFMIAETEETLENIRKLAQDTCRQPCPQPGAST